MQRQRDRFETLSPIPLWSLNNGLPSAQSMNPLPPIRHPESGAIFSTEVQRQVVPILPEKPANLLLGGPKEQSVLAYACNSIRLHRDRPFQTSGNSSSRRRVCGSC